MSSEGCSPPSDRNEPLSPLPKPSLSLGFPRILLVIRLSLFPCSPLMGSAIQTQLITAHPKGSAVSLDFEHGEQRVRPSCACLRRPEPPLHPSHWPGVRGGTALIHVHAPLLEPL